jgi:hypothetical protein
MIYYSFGKEKDVWVKKKTLEYPHIFFFRCRATLKTEGSKAVGKKKCMSPLVKEAAPGQGIF